MFVEGWGLGLGDRMDGSKGQGKRVERLKSHLFHKVFSCRLRGKER